MDSDKGIYMEKIGGNIVQIQELLQNPLELKVRRVRRWPIEAEHIIAMAHIAKGKNDNDQLRVLDAEAEKLIEERERNLRGQK